MYRFRAFFAFTEERVYFMTTFVGETVHILCGETERLNSSVDWYYQPAIDVDSYVIIAGGYLVNGDYGGRLTINGSTLIITNARKDDSGVYTCVEDIGTGTKHFVLLNVQQGKHTM